MMKWLSLNYWIEQYVLGYLKTLLDKSGKGWKTVAGIMVLILAQILQFCVGAYCEAVKAVHGILIQLPYETITDSAIVLIVSGLVHKALDYIPKE